MFEQSTLSWFAGQAGAWLLTYALHSTLLLGLAWLASRRLSKRSLQLEEAVWRCALVGSLVTATLQLAVGADPLAGRWEIAAPAAQMVQIESASPAREAAAPARREPVAASELRSAILPAETLPAVAPAPLPRDAASGFPVSLSQALLGAWLAGAALLTLGAAASYLSLFRRLRHRPRVIGGDALSALVRLAERAGLRQPVRLTSSTRVPVPIALGALGKAEICLPPRAFAALTTEQQEALLAHELGHIVRRDPFWLAFGRIQTGILFFQPLAWIACSRLREISELLSDEWAVGRTGRPLSLAGCLAEVAGWSLPAARPLPVPGMADRPSNLARRIGRLLEEARGGSRLGRLQRGWLAGAVVLALAAVVAVAPGVSAVTRAQAAPQAERVAEGDSGEEAQAAARRERDRSAAPAQEQEREHEHEHEYEHEEEYEHEYEHEDDEASEAAAEAVEMAREAMEDALGDLDLDLDVDLEGLAELGPLFASLGDLRS
jgi:Zn-dependent protease with chaperone function